MVNKECKNLEFINLKILSKKYIKIICENSKIKEYTKNEIIYKQGDKCTNLTLVLEGKISGIKLLSDGKEQKIKTFKRGEFIGETLLFPNEEYPINIISIEKSKIAEISKENLLILLKDEEFLLNYMEQISKKIIKLSNIIEILSYSKIIKRLAKYFYELYFEKNSYIFEIKSKSEIAKELGTHREVVSRNMKKLIENKIIEEVSENKIKISDIAKLEKLIYE